MAKTKAKKKSTGRLSKLDQPLTVGAFLEGLDKFYDGKIEPRFVAIEKRLDDHDKRFDQIDKRFEQIDEKINQIYDHVDGLYKKFEDLQIEYRVIKASLERIEAYIKQDIKDKKVLRQEINKIKLQIHSLMNRVDKLEKRLAS